MTSSPRPEPAPATVPLVLSADSAASLRTYAGRLRDTLAAHPEWSLTEVAATLAHTPSAVHRAALLAADHATLLARLTDLAEGRDGTGVTVGTPVGDGQGAADGPVFVFPGQGPQWPGMASALYGAAPAFRARMDECVQALEPYVDGWPLADTLLGTPDTALLDRPEVAQPALWAVMLSLAALWQSYGTEPAAVLGHSMGEVVAAVVADALTLDDGARVIAHWSRAQAELSGQGEMLSVLAPAEAVLSRLSHDRYAGRLDVAGLNGPASVTISGDTDAVHALHRELLDDGLQARLIAVGLAAHSAHIDRITPRMRNDLAALRPRPARLPFCSALEGRLLAPDVPLDADYWCRNLRSTVLFEQGTRAVLATGARVLLEVSPHPVLTAAMQSTIEATGAPAVTRGSVRRGDAGAERVLRTLGELYVDGVTPDWTVLYGRRPGSLVALPGPRPEEPAVASADARPALIDRLTTLTAAAQHALLEDLVRRQTAFALDLPATDAVVADRTFRDCGIDSASALTLRNRLCAALDTTLPVTLAFDHPTPAALAAHLRTALLSPPTEPAPAPATGDPSDAEDPVVIVGIGCRLPGGITGPDALWQTLTAGTDAVTAFPTDRGWDLTGEHRPGAGGRVHQGEAGFLYDAPLFDAAFFGVNPREALAMDPQQRLLLETSWETFEDAGVDPGPLRGSRTGVFIGAMAMDYGPQLDDSSETGGYVFTGNTGSVLSGRLAYLYGFEGPAVTVDTACSSSLVALHLAVRALRSGECELAVAGGVTVMSGLGMFEEFSRQGALSADGRCKAFSAHADGFGLAEGVGLVLLERLSAARVAGHQVLAVIRGSAINQDGASNGLTAPNGPAQQRVIRDALTDARLAPADVDAIEAHGTGTRLGDPIEGQALAAAYAGPRPQDRPLWLGSVKSNLGHTQAAAGVTGVVKTVLALRHELIPRTLHADEPTPYIDWQNGPLRPAVAPVPWPRAADRPRRAGVSSFGVSGTNAHVILEEAPVPERAQALEDAPVPEAAPADLSDEPIDHRPGPLPYVLSARTPQALRAQADRLLTHLATDPDPAALAYSLATTRAALPHRAAVVASDSASLRDGLRALADGGPHPAIVRGPATGVTADAAHPVFVFPGQGTQWTGMALELLASEPVFAQALDDCATALAEFTDWSLREALADAELLERVDVVQPALWAVMVSLVALWRSYGIEPAAVVGHSQGEIAAAVVAGALSLEDGARVVALRSRAIARSLAGRGGMASVSLPEADLTDRLAPWGGRVQIAAVNGPESVVVSGESQALDELLAELTDEGVRARRIPVDYASHSAQVERLEDELLNALAPLTPGPPTVPFHSTVDTGDAGDAGDTVQSHEAPPLDAAYWYRNLRAPVRFEQTVAALLDAGHRVFVEVSPHPVLTGGIEATAEAAGHEGVVAVGTLRRDQGGRVRAVTALAHLHVHGVRPDWAALVGTRHRVPLPMYAFQRDRFWPERTRPTTPRADTSADGFWDAVEQGDLSALTRTLELADPAQEESLGALLTALSAWRRRGRDSTTLDSWRYRLDWTPVPDRQTPALDGTWLLVVPAEATADPARLAIEEALAEHGGRALPLVLTGPVADRADLAARIAEAASPAAGPGEPGTAAGLTGVISLLALATGRHPEHPDVPTGTADTVTLLQALGDTATAAPLWCVTRGAVSSGLADPVTSPEQAMVWGLAPVAAAEHGRAWGGVIDVPDTWDRRSRTRLAAALAKDTVANDRAAKGTETPEDELALRPTGLYARRLTRAPLGTRVPPRHWRPEGTVLVTGGTGGLGAHTARWLARNHAPHLLLTNRRGPEAEGAAELAAELTALGSRVTIAACDMADRDAVADLVANVPAELPLTAVFHTAAVLDDAVLDELTPAHMDTVLRVKAAGAEHLHHATRHLDLTALVLFSSIAGTLGMAGMGNYAPGNARLDAYAHVLRAEGTPALSVAWAHWAGDGMAAHSTVEGLLRRRGGRTIDPGLALAALQQSLDHDETFLFLGDFDWTNPGQTMTAGRPRALLRALPELRATTTASPDTPGHTQSDDSLTSRLAALPAAEQDRTLRDLVRARAAAVLGHRAADAVDTGRAFKDLGFDSLTAVELRNDLGIATGLSLPSTLIYDHPTPAALAAHLRTRLLGDTPLPATAEPRPATAPDDDPIAIVGMACRLPGGVTSPEDLWQLLLVGGDAISGLPTDRGWDVAGLYDPDPERAGTTYSAQGGFIEDIAGFDAGFFGISPREALAMDPQQRLLLETSWEALERAGIDPDSLRESRTGVFTGISDGGYGPRVWDQDAEVAGYRVTGNAASVASGRVAYALGLEGPAVSVDTACSSSLVALHLAVQALRGGDCSLALAGGVMAMSSPAVFTEFSRLRGLAADGRCKAFGAGADGFGLAEGVGVLVVERLSDARRRGHRVLAVVRGTAVNQDGASNGLTAPNGPAQQRVIRQALASAGLRPGDVDAVEAHGTGTRLGDPIEAEALIAAYGPDREHPLLLGSLKSNIGHAQAAAGVAGVIKMVLSLRQGVVPATLHVDEPTWEVDWSAGAVELVRERRSWPEVERPRRAGVSSFGISGTNAHVILEEAPLVEEPVVVGDSVLGVVPWVVSARSEAALRGQAQRLVAHEEAAVVDVGYSLATSRSLLDHRAVVLGSDRESLLAGVRALAEGRETAGVVRGHSGGVRRAVFVFPGQGSQWVGMAAGLLEESETFRDQIVACDEVLAPLTGWSLVDVLRGVDGSPGLERVDVVQPVLWAVMVGLGRLWRSLGVEPAAVVGHSQGEIAAAVVAGVLSLEDGARVVAERSRLLNVLSGRGGMVSVPLPVDAVRLLLVPWSGAVGVAAVNGPRSVTVSGDVAALEELLARCEADGIDARRVAVDYASHSAHVEDIQAELLDALAPVVMRKAEVPFYSTVTAGLLETGGLDAGYWYRNLRQTVELEETVRGLAEDGFDAFIEVSPHPVLVPPVQDTLDEALEDTGVVLGTLRRDEGGLARFTTSLAQAHVQGIGVDWAEFFTNTGAQQVDLPTYSFQHKRYWLDATPTTHGGTPRRDPAPLDSCTYRVAWHRVDEPPKPQLHGTWLLFTPPGFGDHEWTSAAGQALARAGAEVIPCEIRAEDTSRAAVADTVRSALEGRASDVVGVLSLLALADRGGEPDQPIGTGLTGTILLAQALADVGLDVPLWCVTRGSAVVTDGDRLPGIGQSAVWGMGRIYSLEHPTRWGGSIEVPEGPADERLADRLCAVLAAAPGSGEDQVAIRRSGTFARRLVRAEAPAGPPTAPQKLHGTALVTGGTGALGAQVARWLAGQGVENVLLLSRSGPQAPGAAGLVEEINAMGVRASAVACDVSDRAALAQVIDAVPEDLPLTVVVHTAAVLDDSPIDALRPEQIDRVLRVKVGGALNLSELTAHLDLSAFVLFSSLGGTVGLPGQGNYAPGNAFLDALAQRRRLEGKPATSIAWGAWAGGGMAEGPVGGLLVRHGIPAMAPELALDGLRRALDLDESFMAVADIDWPRFHTAFTAARPSRMFDDIPEVRRILDEMTSVADAGAVGERPLTDRLKSLSAAERARALLQLVCDHLAVVLGHEDARDIPADRALRELGMDSVTGVELRNRLSAATGVKLPSAVVFDHPTPDALARHLGSRLVGTTDTPLTAVQDELGRLEDLLASVALPAADRSRVTTRLQSMLLHWTGAAAPDPESQDRTAYDVTSDDELFDLIDNDLGVS
ncbi:Polyketide synthase [Streptomyces graminofaciens]|uniref:Polyketide synthase n=1 Tax=Streptomyces graminofaciens TaxID=68212 RepID=A0ABM7F0L2_9ACTN|nr:type I polyketide synthase [Streptomyces graminofaciens]BBC29263.1 Polyketide synthase [Streptomyces graminofaciens]